MAAPTGDKYLPSQQQQRTHDLERRMKEYEILKGELTSVKKGKTVYKKQQNSNVFFKSDISETMKDCQRTLESLQQEYRDMCED
ncbi:ASNSD1 upstream open reading frame protein-like [Glandiceps talaboti]